MADLRTDFIGIKSPNPFWLASAPPTDKEYNVVRAFKAGWGGVVWKTLGEDPAVVNVNGPRYGAIHGKDRQLIGLNNIELITDRPLEVNLREIKQVKRDWPDRALVVSLMVPCEEQNWIDILRRVEETEADGVELNFGCPHGMCERGMGSAVGQEPEVNKEITSWAVEFSSVPVLSKLTPNVGDINPHGLASQAGGAHGVSLINTIKSIIGVDIDSFVPVPTVGARSSNGGYCGAAVKPIALHMCAQLARNPQFNIPISGIGGVSNWRDAVEFLLLGASSVQVCTEVMLRGYRVVEDMIEGLEYYMKDHGFDRLDDFIGKAVPSYSEWGNLDLNYEIVAKIDADACIGCNLCQVACHDGAHQCIHPNPDGSRVPVVDEDECVGCNLCQIVCPVDGCITMVEVDNGYPPATWNEHLTEGAELRPKKGSHG